MVMVFVALCLSVIIANYGGWWDNVQRDLIRRHVFSELLALPGYDTMTQEQRDRFVAERLAAEYQAAGLEENFFVKSFRYTWDVMSLNLGPSRRFLTASASYTVGDLILERLPRTVMLFTTGTVLGAIVGVRLGLRMARKALSFEDRAFTAFSMVVGAGPAWMWGVFLILVFGVSFRVLPYEGMVSVPAKTDSLGFALDVLHHMLLPLAAIVLATFGGWAYTTRNLSLQIFADDYVQAARARGLPNRVLMRRYVLRAASPPIVTSLSLAVVNSLSGSIILEAWFSWPGIGGLFWDALNAHAQIPNVDLPVVMGLIAMYAYLIAITTFVLDFVYALLDPRLRIAK